jgi:hypothetical protein
LRQVFFTTRGRAASSGKSGLVSSKRDAAVVGVLHRAEHQLADEPLFRQLRVRHAALDVLVARRAVVEPRVGVEAHVDDVEVDVARVHERLDGLVQEEVAGVLTRPDVHQRRVRSHATDTEVVVGRGHDAGHVRAVPVVVDVRGVLAVLVLARPVDLGHVGGEVPRPLGVEVGRDVGVPGVDPGVHDADVDTLAGRLFPGAVGRRTDHLHVPLQVGQRLRVGLAARAAGLGGAARLCSFGRTQPLTGVAVRHAQSADADRVVPGRTADPGLGAHLVHECRIGRGDQGEAYLGRDVLDGSSCR